MTYGPKKHLKYVAATNHWVLNKLTGVFALYPSTSPHKLRKRLPLIIFLRYALIGDEVKICIWQFIKTDGKVRTDVTYPASFVDVINIDKTRENVYLIYDTKGHFAIHYIIPEEYKLCKMRKIFVGPKGISHLVTHNTCTIHYPDSLIKASDGAAEMCLWRPWPSFQAVMAWGCPEPYPGKTYQPRAMSMFIPIPMSPCFIAFNKGLSCACLHGPAYAIFSLIHDIDATISSL